MKLLKLTAISAALLSTSVMADWSANIGVVSDYHFRGIQQTQSASASVGVDYENGGFYAGAWTAEVEDGLEVDLYGGYGIELDNGLALGLGYTTYQYTGDFDTDYNEFNFSAGMGMFSVEYSVGSHGVDEGDDEDYDFIGLSVEKDGFSATIGSFGKDWDGEYVEFGYGTEIGGFDVGVGLIVSGEMKILGDLLAEKDESLYFSLGKSF